MVRAVFDTERLLRSVFGLRVFLALACVAVSPIVALSQEGPIRCRNEKGEMTVVVREKDKKATLAKGEILLVKLPARLGTGYGWQVAKNDELILKLDGEPQTEEITDENQSASKVGQEEYQVFRFLTLQSGHETLQLEYRRPFDKESPPRKTFKLDLRVEKAGA